MTARGRCSTATSRAEGIDLDFKVMRPRQIFPRMLEHQEFQVSELSFASFVGLKARGN